MIALALALVCVVANAFFVAAEFALAKARPTALEALAKEGDKQAERAWQMMLRLDAYLTATQLGITFASLGLGWLGEPAVADFIQPALRSFELPEGLVHGIAFSLSFAVITFLHIVLGELVPKSLAIQRPETISRMTAAPMQFFYYLTYPLQIIFNSITNGLLKLLGLATAGSVSSVLSASEIKLIIKSSFGDDGAESTKRDLLDRVLTGIDRPVRTVMVPRVDMVTLNLNVSFSECIREVRRHGYSRYPLIDDGDPDNVRGYIYVKDLLIAEQRARQDIRELRRDILFIPETRTVGDALGDFQRQKIPIAIVVDEYGGTSGLVTAEDIVEEIVGDIQDETDAEAPKIRERGQDTWVVSGSIPIQDLELEELNMDISEEGDTLGGYIVAHLERLAYPGDAIYSGKYKLTVEDVRRRRIERVAIRRLSDEEFASSRDSKEELER
ncbi:MAG: HlyC/CorC family transporter [Myxococcales bacterium]|nr:MAG: HlyC/CorC family transporter [Myxococcales bacterium]